MGVVIFWIVGLLCLLSILGGFLMICWVRLSFFLGIVGVLGYVVFFIFLLMYVKVFVIVEIVDGMVIYVLSDF